MSRRPSTPRLGRFVDFWRVSRRLIDERAASRRDFLTAEQQWIFYGGAIAAVTLIQTANNPATAFLRLERELRRWEQRQRRENDAIIREARVAMKRIVDQYETRKKESRL